MPSGGASNSVYQSILKTQIWKNPTKTLAVRALNKSALSILKTISRQPDSNHKLFLMNREPPVDQKIGKKVFIKLYLQTEKLLSPSLLLDSGSDISLIHERELNKLVTPTEIHKYKAVNKHKVETFSNQVINILYNITLPWSFEKHGPTINLTFSVYDQEVTHSLLFGQDNMQKMGMILSYTPAGNTKKPSVRITKPVTANLETQYIGVNPFLRTTFSERPPHPPSRSTHHCCSMSTCQLLPEFLLQR